MQLSQVHTDSILYHAIALDPGRAIVTYHFITTHTVFCQNENIDLYDIGYYEAQYIHLRYGLIHPPCWLHIIRRLLMFSNLFYAGG